MAAAPEEPVCEQQRSTESLNTLRMEACLLKRAKQETKYIGYQITFTNIGQRKIFLTVEQDSLRRFEVSLSSNKVEVLTRPDAPGGHMAPKIYAPFELMLMGPGESRTFVTPFLGFKPFLKKKRIVGDAWFSLSIFPPSEFYIFEDEKTDQRFQRREEEVRTKTFSRSAIFERFQIDWRALGTK
jgi:hypothetical protein